MQTNMYTATDHGAVEHERQDKLQPYQASKDAHTLGGVQNLGQKAICKQPTCKPVNTGDVKAYLSSQLVLHLHVS